MHLYRNRTSSSICQAIKRWSFRSPAGFLGVKMALRDWVGAQRTTHHLIAHFFTPNDARTNSVPHASQQRRLSAPFLAQPALDRPIRTSVSFLFLFFPLQFLGFIFLGP